MKVLATAVLVLGMSSSVFADATEAQCTEATEAKEEACKGVIEFTHPNWYLSRDVTSDARTGTRFRPYETSSAIWQWTEDDEQALEARYSFQYSIYDCRRKNKRLARKVKSGDLDKDKYPHLSKCIDRNWFWKPSVFMSYTGEFDFYVDTRPSGPVINRISNPALHLYFRLGDKARPVGSLGIAYLDISAEHRSDGQATDFAATRLSDGKLWTQIAYDTNDHAYFDTLSRDSDFISVRIGSHKANKTNWQLGFKGFVTQASTINWGPLASKDVGFEDYDVANLTVGRCLFCGETSKPRKLLGSPLKFFLAAQYTVGEELFETDSFELSVEWPFEGWSGSTQFPLMVKVHHGPMDTLSNYSKSVTSIGVGFSFRNWND